MEQIIAEMEGAVDIVFQRSKWTKLVDYDQTMAKNATCSLLDEDASKTKEKSTSPSIVRVRDFQLNARPLYLIDYDDLSSIRQLFQQHRRVLMKTFKSNVFFSCTVEQWESIVAKFMQETHSYVLFQSSDSIHTARFQRFAKSFDSRYRKIISNVRPWKNFRTTGTLSEFNQHQYLPDLRRQDLDLQHRAIPGQLIWPMLLDSIYRRLQPIYDQVASHRRFRKGSDAVLAVQEYHRQDRLKSSTLFVTLYVSRILSTFNYAQAIHTLELFLAQYVPSKEIDGIPTAKMVELIRLLLEHQVLIYKHRMYRQIHGIDNRFPMMLLLVNILLFYWEQEWINVLKETNEVYGRCFDEIFFTWNRSKSEGEAFIRSMNTKYPSIRVEWAISGDVDYLDANISWDNDHLDDVHPYQLETSVHHRSKAEPYVLPYIDGIDPLSPRSGYGQLIRAALIRAVLCCSNFDQFKHEEMYIELSFKLNHFPIDYIQQHRASFYREFGVDMMHYYLYRENFYDPLRRKVIEYDRKHR